VTGAEPMTDAQKSYLGTLARQTGEEAGDKRPRPPTPGPSRLGHDPIAGRAMFMTWGVIALAVALVLYRLASG